MGEYLQATRPSAFCFELQYSAHRLMQNPALNPAIQLIQTENGYAAYDPTTDKLHELNPTASLIVELCDGSRSVEEICAFLAPMLPEGSAEGVQALDRRGSRGRTAYAGAAIRATRTASFRPRSCTRFRAGCAIANKEQIAFVCQQQATELAPNNPDMWYDLGEAGGDAGAARRGPRGL